MLAGMVVEDPKANLHRYLRAAREVLLWKLDGLGEYDLRRPLTPTATNLLGLVKHLAGVEAGYFGDTFGRPLDPPLPWRYDDADPNVDMWATADESRDSITGLYRRVCAHADRTITELELDSVGTVPHWPAERATVTLHQVLVHVLADTDRHAGHADILRELIDGAVGYRRDNDNMAPGPWEPHHERVAAAASAARDAEVRIRPAGADDVPSMTRLVRAAYAGYVPRIGREPAPMRADYASVIAGGHTWVAERNGQLLGVLVLEPADDHLLLENVAVAPEAQGLGVGGRLLTVADEQARKLKLPTVRLYTNEAMTENLEYYTRRGFTETHRAVDAGYRRVYFSKPVE
jgi:N-acetylglutamate synthase-like GNAT family acetyltransferase/uncharacterized damage-inducible protein DinB